MNTFAFRVGALECFAISDGDTTYRAADYVVNAPPAHVAQALAEYGDPPDDIPSPYSGLLVRTGANLVLIDTGAGDLTPTVGKLLVNLRSAGVEPSEIDTIILTHGHPDHIGGNVDADGRLVFPNARHVAFRAEWDYWTDEATLARLAPVFGKWSRKNLGPIRNQVDLLDSETEIVAGVEAIDAAGHTPGHLALSLRSGGEELLYVSDAALHPIHLEHPDWHAVWDFDPAQAIANRRRLFDRAATDHALVLAFHFSPFPSLGHVSRRGDGWQWHPIAIDEAAGAY
jgi:glyoxylase-like metal-dependent hydrolase (beta-lactamase superfamily II)